MFYTDDRNAYALYRTAPPSLSGSLVRQHGAGTFIAGAFGFGFVAHGS